MSRVTELWCGKTDDTKAPPRVCLRVFLRFNGTYMCELVHGAPPTPDHEAAHSCGKGHEGCIHPKHLSWATHSENQLDRREHGTNKKKGGPRPIITPEKAAEIRVLYDGKMPIIYIAAKFGISRSTVYYWLKYREELGYGKAA